jgi:hypothetical protein
MKTTLPREGTANAGMLQFQNLLRRNLKALILALIMLAPISNSLSAQSDAKAPIDLVLIESAPHIPWIQRVAPTENESTDGKIKYEQEKNTERIEKWVEQYPSEVTPYRQAMEKFFKETAVNDLAGQEKDFYHDMKAQYQMIKKLLKWESINQNH